LNKGWTTVFLLTLSNISADIADSADRYMLEILNITKQVKFVFFPLMICNLLVFQIYFCNTKYL